MRSVAEQFQWSRALWPKYKQQMSLLFSWLKESIRKQRWIISIKNFVTDLILSFDFLFFCYSVEIYLYVKYSYGIIETVFRTTNHSTVYLRRHGSTTIQNNFGKFFYRLSWHQKFRKKKSFNFESKCFIRLINTRR